MKLHRYVDHQRLHIVTKDVISLSISVLLLFRHYISHKIILCPQQWRGVMQCLRCFYLLTDDRHLNGLTDRWTDRRVVILLKYFSS